MHIPPPHHSKNPNSNSFYKMTFSKCQYTSQSKNISLYF